MLRSVECTIVCDSCWTMELSFIPAGSSNPYVPEPRSELEHYNKAENKLIPDRVFLACSSACREHIEELSKRWDAHDKAVADMHSRDGVNSGSF